jgi:hypothetical protein
MARCKGHLPARVSLFHTCLFSRVRFFRIFFHRIHTGAIDPMTSLERRSSASLALIFALRMLGLFLVLPVFALEARKYPGGDDPAWWAWPWACTA